MWWYACWRGLGDLVSYIIIAIFRYIAEGVGNLRKTAESIVAEMRGVARLVGFRSVAAKRIIRDLIEGAILVRCFYTTAQVVVFVSSSNRGANGRWNSKSRLSAGGIIV